jgi:hypothetical protein
MVVLRALKPAIEAMAITTTIRPYSTTFWARWRDRNRHRHFSTRSVLCS